MCHAFPFALSLITVAAAAAEHTIACMRHARETRQVLPLGLASVVCASPIARSIIIAWASSTLTTVILLGPEHAPLPKPPSGFRYAVMAFLSLVAPQHRTSLHHGQPHGWDFRCGAWCGLGIPVRERPAVAVSLALGAVPCHMTSELGMLGRAAREPLLTVEALPAAPRDWWPPKLLEGPRGLDQARPDLT